VQINNNGIFRKTWLFSKKLENARTGNRKQFSKFFVAIFKQFYTLRRASTHFRKRSTATIDSYYLALGNA